ncbi:MAG: DUF2293 domain-containing protein [Planctomycetes bacterium]|nr:DUF2293 domain-containing protein [Planctomycetota bacterium]
MPPLPHKRITQASRILLAGPRDGTLRTSDGSVVHVPDGWALLEPGDATLTRRVKAAGPSWTVQEKQGRRTFSRGVWAPAETISRIKAELEEERSTEAYAKKRQSDLVRRERAQEAYVEDFHAAIITFLNFHPAHGPLAEKLARLVTTHATPVGSGTVARTRTIPIGRRAEAAVIAWMRHRTTGYDTMPIARVKGRRREVRRMLAGRSRELLQVYRSGPSTPEDCPLAAAARRIGENP